MSNIRLPLENVKQYDFFRENNEADVVLQRPWSPVRIPSVQAYVDEAVSEDTASSWVPHCERMVIAGKHVRVSRFENPYYSGGKRQKNPFKEYGRASTDVTPEQQEENRKKNARRRETKVKDLIRCNVRAWKKSEELKHCNKFLSLTLQQDIRDISDANPYLKGFFGRLVRMVRRQYPGFRLQHIWVVEFQDENRGVVHYHLLCNLPYIDQRPVITRGRPGSDRKEYQYLQKDGSWSPVANKQTMVFRSFHDAKKHIQTLSVVDCFGYDVKVKKILYDLAVCWGHGFVDIEVVNNPKKAKAYTAKMLTYLTKAGNDDRFCGKRAFDYSRGNLEKPVVFDDSYQIDHYIDEHELWLALVNEYYFDCYLGNTEMYIFDLYLLDDVSFNPPPTPPPQCAFAFA